MSFNPTQEQVNAVSTAITGKSMKLSAYAGTGKTTTLKMIGDAFNRMNKHGLYLAFNKGIADESRSKMPRNVMCKTFHALALANSPSWVKKKLNNRRVNSKQFAIDYGLSMFYVMAIRQHFKTKRQYTTKVKFSLYDQHSLIEKALEIFMKSAAQAPALRHLEQALDDRGNIDIESYPIILDALGSVVARVWANYTNPEVDGYIPHDCYLKMWALQNPILNCDFILFDEAQDADPIMFQILSRQPCQVIYVGDQYQQIYSWRGAINMMQRLDNLKLPTSSITQSFRFGQELAVAVSPVLTYLGATESLKGTESTTTIIDNTVGLPQDINVVICRTNIGAVRSLFEYAAIGKIGMAPKIDLNETKDLVCDIDKFKNGKLPNKHENRILRWFDNYEELLEYQKAFPNDLEIVPILKIYQVFGLEDTIRVIDQCILAKETEIYDFLAVTAHSSKGLEFDKVLLGSDFIDQFADGGVLSIESITRANPEEFRLLYVAMTRAKKTLYDINVRNLVDLIAKCPTLPEQEAQKAQQDELIDSLEIEFQKTLEVKKAEKDEYQKLIERLVDNNIKN